MHRILHLKYTKAFNFTIDSTSPILQSALPVQELLTCSLVVQCFFFGNFGFGVDVSNHQKVPGILRCTFFRFVHCSRTCRHWLIVAVQNNHCTKSSLERSISNSRSLWAACRGRKIARLLLAQTSAIRWSLGNDPCFPGNAAAYPCAWSSSNPVD